METNNIAIPESDISEWKWSWRDEYMKWLAAFAYTDGGTLNIGVNDDGYVVGLSNYRELLEILPNKIRDKLRITPKIRLRWADHRGDNIRYPSGVPEHVALKQINQYACGSFTPKTDRERSLLAKWEAENPVSMDFDGRYYYIEIVVEHYSGLVTYDGIAYTRSGSTLQILEGQELEKAVLKSTGLTWDAFDVSSMDVSDLDHAAIDALRKKAVEKKRLTPAQVAVPDKDLIRKLNLMTEDGKLTRAAVMLFSDPERVATGAYIKIGYFGPVGQYGNNTINDVIYHDEVRGPLILQADNAIDILYAKYLKAMIGYNGLQRVETYMLPQDAMREILLNAIAHKFYPSGNPIQIKVYDDHITVMNQGFWPFDLIQIENIYKNEHGSFPGNPKIAEGLYMAGDIETWGSGFEKIKIACTRYGTPLPKIEATKGSVTAYVTPAEAYMSLLKRSSSTNSITSDGVSDGVGDGVSRKEKILAFCSVPRSRGEIQDFLQIKSEQYLRTKLLNPLIAEGALARTNPEKPNTPKQKYITVSNHD